MPRVADDTLAGLPRAEPLPGAATPRVPGPAPRAPAPRARRPGLHLSRPLRRLVAVVAAGAIAIGLLLATVPGARRQAALAFTRVATPYTELLFTRPGDLPTTLDPAGPAQVVGVTVRDHGTGTRSSVYAYRVAISGDGRPQTTTEGSVRVAPGGSRSFQILVKPTARASSYAVTVTLAGRPDLVVRFRASGP